jgi:hypothetical protein
MQNMLTFYTQLMSAQSDHDPYLSWLARFTELDINQIVTLKSIVIWDLWV